MRLSLRWKLVGGFGLMLVLIGLLGWVTLALFGSFRNVQREVFDDAFPGVVAADEIVRSYTAQSAAIRGYLIGSELALLEQYNNEVGFAQRWENEAEAFFRDDAERRLLDQLRTAGAQFHELVDEVIALARRGNRSQAFRVLSQEGSPLITRIEFLGRDLAAAQDVVVAEGETELRLRANQTIVILLLVVVAALGVGIVLAFLLPRRLAANVNRLVEATRAIGRGDLNQKIDIHSGDEFEELAERFEEMQAGLKRLQQLALQDRELEIAASIQQNLLQRNLPEVKGVRVTPSQQLPNLVGGDWYDVDVEGDELAVVVGDASGKGIGAALMATVALTVLRAERSFGATPQQVVDRANQALKEATDAESFTTCVYTTLNPASGELKILNMGHTSPFMLYGGVSEDGTAKGRYVEGDRNRVLGWFEDPGLAETIVTLTPGDRVVLYTDGYLEAKDPSGEIFGEHRFADALLSRAPLGSEALTQEMAAEVERFAAGKLDDDLTMLVVEYTGSRIETGPADQGGD